MPESYDHIPVLCREVLDALHLKPGQIVADCTLGRGGHATELLRAVSPGGKLIGLDMDPLHVELARERLPKTGDFVLKHSNFAALPTILAGLGIERVDAILADLGVASMHIDDPARGFSYRRPGPLDMRMDPTRGQPVSALLAKITQTDLATALREIGDEEDALAIADLVIRRRAIQPITTTEDLMAIVCQARQFTLKRAAGAKLHPAARTFQVLRILVNRELANLQRLLAIAPDLLSPTGTIAIISFHSGEDRLVKASFKQHKETGIYSQISPDPITADAAEVSENPRSRSAKLRWARRA
jgi:16S rRNA (cytosine1402-N4)-methyltransferase